MTSGYWSSTPYATTSDEWLVEFSSGAVGYFYRVGPSYYCALCGADRYGLSADLVVNGDGTVTDTTTDLMWQQCHYGQTWDGAQCTGSAGTRTWNQAFAYVQELKAINYLGYDDWRLPTRNELQSLVDYSRL